MTLVSSELLWVWCYRWLNVLCLGRATSALVLGELLQLWYWVSYFSSGVEWATSALVLSLCRARLLRPLLGQRSALSVFCQSLVLGQVLDSILSLVSCSVYLWDGEVLLSLCPGLNCCPTAVPSLRSGGSVSFWPCALHSCFSALPHLPFLRAKSYNIVGRRQFCCLELF